MEEKTQALQSAFPKLAGLAVLLPRFAKLLLALFKDPRVPRYLKILTAGAAAYVAFPLDILPDFVPTAGKVDDLIVILLILMQYIKSCPPDVFIEHWDAVMGDDYDIEEDARVAMEELGPLVGNRFSVVKDWILNAATRIGSETDTKDTETSDEQPED